MSVFRFQNVLKKIEVASIFPSPPFRSSDLRTSGAFRIARDAGGEAVDVNENLVEREKGDQFGIETTAS